MKRLLLSTLAMCLFTFGSIAQELALVVEKKEAGYINKSGEYVIKPQFRKADDFSGRYAAAMKDKKWGFIDATGKWVIEPQYDKAKAFNSGYALVLEDKEWKYINNKNETLTVPATDKFFDFNDGVAFIRVDNKIGLIDTKGKTILEPKYVKIMGFHDGHAKFQDADAWGIISKTGEVVVPAEYEEISRYSKSGLWAKKGGEFGVINNGKFTPISGIEKIWDFTNSSKLTYARSNGKMGFINAKGEWVIEPTYDKARAFNAGLAPVAQDKEWGYIDESGKIVINFKYRDAEIFSNNGLAPVKEKKLWGFIDKTGKLVIPMEYDISIPMFGFIQSGDEKGFVGNTAKVRKKKQWGFINEKGEVLGKWYRHVGSFVDTSK